MNVPKEDLRPLLLLMTTVTGLIDAFSYLGLGHVLTANMTGNIVFLAFSLAGTPGFSIFGSLLALGAFVLGAFVGGWLGSRLSSHPLRLLAVTAIVQMLLLGVCVIVVTVIATPWSGGDSSGLIVILAIAMGLQNAAARKVSVADFTTTVLTLTLTGIGADNRLAGGSGSKAARRLLPIGAMFLGAGLGGLLIIQVSLVAPLIVALVLLLLVVGETLSWSELASLPTQTENQQATQAS